MANLDTRSKRASSVQILAPAVLSPVLPDATIDQGDRQHVALTYSGILATGAGGASLLAIERAQFRRMFGRVFGRVN